MKTLTTYLGCISAEDYQCNKDHPLEELSSTSIVTTVFVLKTDVLINVDVLPCDESFNL